MDGYFASKNDGLGEKWELIPLFQTCPMMAIWVKSLDMESYNEQDSKRMEND